jgi:hyperosmotically inducible periplasmic protein
MNARIKQQIRRALWGAAAGVVAASFAACDQKPATDKIGKASSRMEQAANTAEKKIDEAGNVVTAKSAATGEVLGDAALTAKVRSALIAEPGLNSLTIDVEASAGIVTLRGTADTAANRDKAVQLASNVEGVKSVRNDLVVVKGS